MSTRRHVRALVDQLTPAGLTPLLEQARGLTASDALDDAEAAFSAIPIGGGAAAMHERQSWGDPSTPLFQLSDPQALLLCGLSLRAAARAPRRLQIRPALQRLDQLHRDEPDFFDELLLELSRRFHTAAPFAELLRAHADALRAEEHTLRALDRVLFPDNQPGIVSSVKRLFGAGGDPARPLRLACGLVLLDAKEPPHSGR